jgi:hypothetical protein
METTMGNLSGIGIVVGVNVLWSFACAAESEHAAVTVGDGPLNDSGASADVARETRDVGVDTLEAAPATDSEPPVPDGSFCLQTPGCAAADGGLTFVVSPDECFSRPSIDCSQPSAANSEATQIAYECGVAAGGYWYDSIGAVVDANGCVTSVIAGSHDLHESYFLCVADRIMAERWPCAADGILNVQCQFN